MGEPIKRHLKISDDQQIMSGRNALQFGGRIPPRGIFLCIFDFINVILGASDDASPSQPRKLEVVSKQATKVVALSTKLEWKIDQVHNSLVSTVIPVNFSSKN